MIVRHVKISCSASVDTLEFSDPERPTDAPITLFPGDRITVDFPDGKRCLVEFLTAEVAKGRSQKEINP